MARVTTTGDSLPPLAPSQDDPVVRGATTIIGGPMGERAATNRSWWNPVRVVLVMAVLASGLGAAIDMPCIANSWSDGYGQFSRGCYSDIVHLYWDRGIADGLIPYVEDPTPSCHSEVEYPVLTGAVMWLLAQPVPDGSHEERGRDYFIVNAIAIALLLAIAAWATALTVRRRPWDAAMVALAPGMILASTVNWDLWAVATTSLALLAWARKYPVLAGVLIGLAAAFKFYPVLILGPLLILCLRAGRMRAWLLTFGGALI